MFKTLDSFLQNIKEDPNLSRGSFGIDEDGKIVIYWRDDRLEREFHRKYLVK